MRKRLLLVTCTLALSQLLGAEALGSKLKAKIDETVHRVLDKTGVPSALLGIVQDGRVIYTAAYGKATVQPDIQATPQMHYPIGSISKQFTAACVLLLQQQGKLTVDDPISKWFPEFTDAAHITIRNLLTHTSGYSDYAPQDYTIPAWIAPTEPTAVVHQWATKDLDFQPGTKHEYSNTNFVIAGLIVQKASGQPFWSFLKAKILDPLGMNDTIDLDSQGKLIEPTGYMRFAFGPPRPAALEGPGWYFADGEMAMPVKDLLTWDISLINQTVLKPESYLDLETEHRLNNGQGTGYGLGVGVGQWRGHRMLSHGGEVGGFVASNVVLPDDKVAVAVLTNEEASSAAGSISREVLPVLFEQSAAAGRSSETAKAESVAKAVLAGLQQSKLDRTLLTSNCNYYFTDQAIADYRTSLGKLGAPSSFELKGELKRGGMTGRLYTVKWSGGREATLSTYWTPDGKIEQFLIEPQS